MFTEPPSDPIFCVNRRTSRGFNLVEVIAIMAIVAVLSALALPVVGVAMSGSQLTAAGQMLNNVLNSARQTAVAKNHRVEVRLYRFAADGGPVRYAAVQLYEIGTDGEATPLDKVFRFPASIVAASDSALSSLLKPSQDKQWTDIDRKMELPGIGPTYECSAFRFLPDGTTTLSTSAEPWFITLHDMKEGDQLKQAPRNFICLQINAHNGQIRSYRP